MTPRLERPGSCHPGGGIGESSIGRGSTHECAWPLCRHGEGGSDSAPLLFGKGSEVSERKDSIDNGGGDSCEDCDGGAGGRIAVQEEQANPLAVERGW